MKKFWKWAKDEISKSSNSELILEGPIDSESWWGDEVTPKAFREELEQHEGDLTVRINSPGGDVYAALSIYNEMKDSGKNITVVVDSLAASAASYIAMAGDKIIMNTGSMMMVHKPWQMAIGNSEDLREVADYLEKVGSSIVSIYAARTGKTVDEINALLDAETWMTAEEAVEMGFADEAIPGKTRLSDAIKNAFNFDSVVKSAVLQPMMSLKTKLETTPPKKEVEETDVADTTETNDEAANAVDEDTPADESQAEAPSEGTEVKPAKEDDMSKTEEIAKSQVLDPKNQAPVESKPKVKDYLKTKESMEAFAQVLEQQAGRSSEDVRMAWKEHLETKMGVTNPEIFLPEPLITAIEDAFTAGGEIWNRVTKTGADVWRATWDSNTDVDAESGRGKGYNRAEQAEKAEQELTFAQRILRPQMIYKYITLNREDVKNQRSTGALVRFVLAELPRRIIREVERAIVIGDGRAPGSDYKIQPGTPEGFFPIKDDTDAGNAFAATYVPLEGESPYASVVKANDLLEAEGTPVLICKKGYVTTMKLERAANGGFVFPLGANFRELLEVEAIVQPDWMVSDEDNDAYLVILPNYRVVGDTSIEAFTNFLLKTNKQEYLQEIWAGGGLTVRKSAVAISATPASS